MTHDRLEPIEGRRSQVKNKKQVSKRLFFGMINISMSHTRVIAYNTSIHIVGKALGVVISFFLFRLIARYLGVTGVGDYITIFAYSNFLAILADLGFQIIIVRALSTVSTPEADQNTSDRIASTIISMRTVVAIGVFIVGSLVAQLLPYPPVVKLGIVFGAIATFWLSINSTLVGIFQANFRMDKAVLTDLVGKILNLIAVAVVVALDAGLMAIMAAYTIGNLVNVALNYLFVSTYIRIKFIFDWVAWQRYFKDALTFGTILIFAYIYFRIDALMLSLMKGSYDVGIYGVPYKILDIILLVPAIFMGVVFPLFAKYGHKNRQRLARIFTKSQDALIIVGLPITAGIIILAQPIVDVIGGQEFLTASTVQLGLNPITAVHTLQILMVAVFLSFLSHPYNYVLTANGYQGKLVIPNISYAVFNIGLNLILIPKFSYLAAAVITVLTELAVFLIPRQLAKRYLGIQGHSQLWLKAILATLMMGLTAYYLQSKFIVWPIMAGAVVYVGLLWLLKGIDREMVKELISSRIR